MNRSVIVLLGAALMPFVFGCATARVVSLPKDHVITKAAAVRAVDQIARDMAIGNVNYAGISLPAKSLVGADETGWKKITYLWNQASPAGYGAQTVPVRVDKVYYKDIDRVEIFSTHWSYWVSMGACTLFMLNFDGMTMEGHVVMKDGTAQKVNWVRSDAGGFLGSFFGGVLFPGYILAYNLPDRWLQQKLWNFEYMRMNSQESSSGKTKSMVHSGIPCSLCQQSGMMMKRPIHPEESAQIGEDK